MKLAWACLAVLLAASAARAGIYNSTENKDEFRSEDVSRFRETLAKFRNIGYDKVEVDSVIRKRYLLCEALGGAQPPASLTLEQKLDYGAVLIRRKKFQQAIDFLTPLTRRHPEVFLFDSHLAMAYWGSGQQGNDRRAFEIMSQMLGKNGSWPESFSKLSAEQRTFLSNSLGWDEGDYVFYRQAELALLKLMKLRLAEPSAAAYESVDAVFDDGQKPAKAIRFVNEDGKFEPGRIAAAERKKLPPNALAIVEQLNFWLPEDLRLYWLLGELANSQWSPEHLDNPVKRDLALSNLKAADRIFDELVFAFSVRAADLRERRRILQEYVKTVEDAPASHDDFGPSKIDPPAKADPPMPMSGRNMAITFAAGFAVGVFTIWQYQELRRRRRAK